MDKTRTFSMPATEEKMTKGKSHNRSRGRILNSIRRGQARKLRAIEAREHQAGKGYDKQSYDKPASEES
jgi:hypothetical protein